MKDYRNYYGQSIPTLHGKAIQVVINSIKGNSNIEVPCVSIEGLGTLSVRDEALIEKTIKDSGLNCAIMKNGSFVCSDTDSCLCDNTIKERKIDLLYINLENQEKNFTTLWNSYSNNSESFKGAYIILSLIKENRIEEDEVKNLGFDILDIVNNSDDTLFVVTLRYSGKKVIANKKTENKKEAPTKEIIYNTDNSE